MRTLPRSISRPAAGGAALFARIADAVSADIRRGALRAGDRLPSTRELARQLDVNRNTVVAAFDELVAQGWIEPDGARGTRVAAGLADMHVMERGRVTTRIDASMRPTNRGVTNRARTESLPYQLREVPGPGSPLGLDDARFHLSVGVPDTRLLPHALLARAYRRALHSPKRRAVLDYAPAHGAPRLRSAIAEYLRGRGLAVGAENILVTRGSQMAIDLAARALIRPGDSALVEELGYQPAWRALAEAGAKLVGAPLDDAGIVTDHLPAARVLYTTPHHQYPTTVVMAPARRMALLAYARRGTAIIEDDYDHEFHFDGRPVAPLAATDPHVIYVGTLSKILAPGLRLGFVAAPIAVIETLARLRASIDRQGDQVLETAIAELIEDGEVARHARKVRRAYLSRRDAMVAALHEDLAGAVTFDIPAGGMTLWARVARDIPLDTWRARALERGVAVAFAKQFSLDGRPRPFVRLGFAHLTEREIGDAIRAFARALPGR